MLKPYRGQLVYYRLKIEVFDGQPHSQTITTPEIKINDDDCSGWFVGTLEWEKWQDDQSNAELLFDVAKTHIDRNSAYYKLEAEDK